MRYPLSIPVTTCGLLCLSLAGPAMAADASVYTHIERVMISADDSDGGCMAKLSVPPQTQLPACAADWVSFSCTGEFAEPLRAYRMLDQAQLALVTGNQTEVSFTDANLHDGHCFAYRIDVYDAP